MKHTQIIWDVLRELGIASNYISQRRTVVAIRLAVEDENRLLGVIKNIYFPTAQICDCKWTAVERNIRTVTQRVWSINSEGLIRMAGYPLNDAPTAAGFLEILSHHIRQSLSVDCVAQSLRMYNSDVPPEWRVDPQDVHGTLCI